LAALAALAVIGSHWQALAGRVGSSGWQAKPTKYFYFEGKLLKHSHYIILVKYIVILESYFLCMLYNF
jgi:hypothetical protein